MTEPIRDRTKFQLFCTEEEGKTEQHHEPSCNINTLMDKYQQGMEPPIPPDIVNYADVSQVTNYHDAVNLVAEAQELFDKLPSRLRNRFDNDMEKLLVFVLNPDNDAESIKLGLIKAPEKPAPTDPVDQTDKPPQE